MNTFGKENVIFSFNPSNTPVYFAKDGETLWIETDDCYGGQIKSISDLRPNINISIMDAAVGPIEIENATPKDTLCVEILDIQFADHGVMVTSPGLGILGDRISNPETKIIPIKNGFAYFSKEIKLPLTPMIGVMGVSPRSGNYHCATPGDFGGNMDTREVTIGSKVYLPIYVDGAMLAVSDLHACMGDGELSGTGIETAGKVCLKIIIIKGKQLKRPMIETDANIYTIATSPTYDEAVRVASLDMVNLLSKKLNLNFPDAYRLLSAACNIRISQVVNGVYTLKVEAPKFLFKGCTVI